MVIRERVIPLPLIQGGMGVGVSLAPLAGEVARLGGVGTVSTAALDTLLTLREGRPFTPFEAARHELAEAGRLAQGGYLAANIMCACATTYEDSVRGAVAGGVDAIISGAGLPTSLPFLLADSPQVALIPIVSSLARAAHPGEAVDPFRRAPPRRRRGGGRPYGRGPSWIQA